MRLLDFIYFCSIEKITYHLKEISLALVDCYKKTDEWYIECYNKWQRVPTSGTKSDNEWKQVTTSNERWQWVTENGSEW